MIAVRPPRANEYQKENPTHAGKWWFAGVGIVPGILQTVVPVQNRPFDVIQGGKGLILTDPNTGARCNAAEFVGWWVEEASVENE